MVMVWAFEIPKPTTSDYLLQQIHSFNPCEKSSTKYQLSTQTYDPVGHTHSNHHSFWIVSLPITMINLGPHRLEFAWPPMFPLENETTNCNFCEIIHCNISQVKILNFIENYNIKLMKLK